jgi:hypothetical protein
MLQLTRHFHVAATIQILLLNAPSTIAGGERAGSVEGLLLGLDEGGTLWTGKLSAAGGPWLVQWTEVTDQARAAREAALKAQTIEADKRRP